MIQVLVVEDDARIAEINRRFVEKVDGFVVDGIATDGLQAKEMIEILQPDLILLDLYVPMIEGFELLKHIKSSPYRTDVIMITAAKDLQTVRDAIHSGVFDYMVKPVIFERFKETMEKYRTFYHKLKSLEQSEGRVSMDQSKIDELLKSTGERSKDAFLPKGIDQITLEKVESYLKTIAEQFSADQISSALGISRSTSRRYLEYLVSLGRIKADLSYGTVGRPERLYRMNHQ
jgi:two-component system CitB family response regulator